MYYLIEINGKMVSGTLITKSPPPQKQLSNLVSTGKKNEGEIVKITPLTIDQLKVGAAGEGNIFDLEAQDLTDNQLIRKYLDNLKKD